MTYCGSSYRNGSYSCGCGNTVAGTGAGCVCDNNGNCSCSNGVGGANTSCGCSGNRPSWNFPPRPSGMGTCPPGTYPCPCRPYPPYPGCGCGCSGCNGSCGNNGCNGGCGNQNAPVGSFAFLNSSGTTLTTGSIIPLRYVFGTGNLAKNTSGGSIGLESGSYSAVYSVSGVIPDAGTTVTITPEYGGVLHTELARSFTSAAAAQSFEISGVLGMSLPTDTTLNLNVTVTGDATADLTLTGVNASMNIRKVSNCVN